MRKLNITIIAGLLVALMGAGIVFAYGRSVDKRIAAGRQLVPVVVATSTLEPGMDAAAVRNATRVAQMPREYVAEGALTDLASVPDVVLRGPVAVGQQLTASSFGTPDAAPLVQPSKGNIALAIEVGLSPGVARYITPGSAVDIFVTFAGGGTAVDGAIAPGSGDTDRRTKLFASGVKVLSVSVAPPPVAEGETAAAVEQPLSQVLAVLDVSPVEAERIVNATTLGKLYLGLSSAVAQHRTPTGVTPADVISANR